MLHWWHQLSSEQHKCCKTLPQWIKLCRVTFLQLGSLANDAGLNIFQICLVSQITKHCFADSPREPCSALLASFQLKVAKSWKAAQLYNNLDKLIPQCNRSVTFPKTQSQKYQYPPLWGVSPTLAEIPSCSPQWADLSLLTSNSCVSSILHVVFLCSSRIWTSCSFLLCSWCVINTYALLCVILMKHSSADSNGRKGKG